MQTNYLHYCTTPSLSIAANIAAMGDIENDHRFVKALIDTCENGIVRRAAKKIGVAASTLNRHYKGGATTKLGRDTYAKLRQHYPNFHGWLTLSNEKILTEVSSFGDRPYEEKFGDSPLPAIPLVGSAIGMTSFDPERDIELTELDMSEVLDQVARPSSLARDGEAYALTVIGDSMEPKFEPGARVIVSPRARISPNDYVVVQLRGNDIQVAATNPDPVTLVLIKRLIKRSASFIELRQFNPDITFRVEADKVAKIHRVIGEVY